MYKYIIIFPVDEEPFYGEMREIMDRVATISKLPPPYLKIIPHITFHRPIVGVDEEVIKNIVMGVTLHIRQTRITVNHLYHFGKQYIVLPVQTTRIIANFWVSVNHLLSELSEYEHGEYDQDNTLHITVAEKTSAIFDEIWPLVKNYVDEEITIPVTKIEIHRKLLEGGSSWEKIAEYQIPK